MNRARRAAFTLVEVILAIIIISGIMVVLLYFYQRTAETRENALREAEFISTARMVLEQLSSELRTARIVQDRFLGLDGTSNSISFVCTALPSTTRWIIGTNESVVLPAATDLKRVHYGLLGTLDASLVAGLERSEFLLTAAPAEPEPVPTDPLVDSTPLPGSASTNYLNATNSATFAGPLLTDKIRFVQFRYWDGSAWSESWGGMDLPTGVEVSLGQQPMPLEMAESGEEGYPFELFRRVIFLPNSTHPANRVVIDPLIEEEAPL